jgi:cytochrome b subunit of formate dehydrogenase
VSGSGGDDAPAQRLLVRHRPLDRVYHWLMALCVLTLLVTGLLPAAGVKFGWVMPHWIAGLVLTVLVVFHVVRSLFWLEPGAMLIGAQDARNAWQFARWTTGASDTSPSKPGKYPLAQKLYHHAIAVVVLAAVTTGLLMMVKIDTPWWKRDPYWLADATWGVIYVVHDFASMLLVSMIMVHVYFGLRPEKLWLTRSMIRGWITREEYLRHHDPQRWSAPATTAKREARADVGPSAGRVVGD